MTEVNFSLHPGQLAVYQDPHRFKVVSAGRRWGKSRLAAIWMLTAGLESRRGAHDLRMAEVWYLAPTFEMCRDILWRMLQVLGEKVIARTWQNDLKAELVNGRLIQLKSADKPERLRGVALSDVVFDEYADQAPETWEYIIRPTLADVEGRALFIGTPIQRNHFYELYLQAQISDDWGAWTFTTRDNPFIPGPEVDRARSTMTTAAFRQEFEASFDTFGATILDPNLVLEGDEPSDGQIYMAVDLGGFGDTDKLARSALLRLDETAIAVVKVGPYGWYVLDIIHGRWGVRETSVQILRAVQRYRPLVVGIERGISRQAVAPYLEDQRRRFGIAASFVEVTHNSKSKTSRIAWALQGRLEKGTLRFAPGDYLRGFREQCFDFPNGRHDDLLDALAYVDQVASTVYLDDIITDSWEPLDEAVGY